MLKKFFNWTARDIAYWEEMRRKGLRKFIVRYGVLVTGGIFFILFGLATFISWLRLVSGMPVTSTSIIFLVGELLVVGLICQVAGVLNSLITWVVEERLYRKYKARIE